MADENDADAVARHGADGPEKAFGLLRGQDRGWLVQYENARAAKKRLDDFQALLLSHGQIPHQRIRIQLQAIATRNVLQSLAGMVRIQSSGATGLAHHEVFQHRVSRHQMKVLVHHSDSRGERVRRPGDGHRAAVDLDAARIGAVHPEEHVHERGLAGAVLAQQSQHLSGAKLEIHRRVRQQIPEPLFDAAHGQ